MEPKAIKRDCLVLVVLGLLFILGYGCLSIEFGGVSLSSGEAWSRGVAQPYMASGILPVFLATLLYWGVTWIRWLVLL